MVEQVRGRAEQGVVPAQLADVVQRGGHRQVACVRFVDDPGGAAGADQLDDLLVGLLVLGQALVDQQGKDLGTDHIAALELLVGQVEHVGGLLQLGGARLHAFLQRGVELLQAIVLFLGEPLQAPPLAFGVEILERLAQGQEQFVVVPRLAEVMVDASLVDRLGDGRQVGMAGEQDPNGLREAAVDFRQQGGAVHVRHPRIGDHQVDGTTVEQLQGLLAAFRQQQVVGLVAQQAPQAAEDQRFVVDQQDAEADLRLAGRRCAIVHECLSTG